MPGFARKNLVAQLSATVASISERSKSSLDCVARMIAAFRFRQGASQAFGERSESALGGIDFVEVLNLGIEIAFVLSVQPVAARFGQDSDEREQELEVFLCGRETKRIDRNAVRVGADSKIR